MKRRFACNKYKSYGIRNHKFENGLFETEDPDVIKLIEGADGYGVIIHPCETAEELAAMKEAEAKEPGPNMVYTPFDFDFHPLNAAEDDEAPKPIAHQGARGTGSTRGQRKGHIITGKEK